MISYDDSFSLSEHERIFYPKNFPVKQAVAPQVINVWGTVVVGFMTDKNVDTQGLGYNFGEAKVTTAVDDLQFTGTVPVGESGASWPGLFSRDDNHFLAFYTMRGGLGLVLQLYELPQVTPYLVS
jgi:hypothetical protein